MQSAAKELLSSWRIANCLRVPTASLVELYHHPEHSTASYGGLQTCGSVHVCPCCGAKIGERRKQDVTGAIVACSECGGSLTMATFTLQHQAGDSLHAVASALNDAFRYLKAGKAWIGFEARYGLLGSIAAREYTHGANGWHPHLHVLFFSQRGLSKTELRTFTRWLNARWGVAVKRLERFASPEYGVRVDYSDKAIAEYMTKAGRSWTLADELTKANRKKGRTGRTPPQLLQDYNYGDLAAGTLFQEYAEYTYRKNALVWSRGLRAALGLVEPEKSDEELAAELEAGGRLLVVFERNVWRVILANDARADVLLVAGAGDVEQVAAFVRGFGVELDATQFTLEL